VTYTNLSTLLSRLSLQQTWLEKQLAGLDDTSS